MTDENTLFVDPLARLDRLRDELGWLDAGSATTTNVAFRCVDLLLDIVTRLSNRVQALETSLNALSDVTDRSIDAAIRRHRDTEWHERGASRS
jgi:hypothetical protein